MGDISDDHGKQGIRQIGTKTLLEIMRCWRAWLGFVVGCLIGWMLFLWLYNDLPSSNRLVLSVSIAGASGFLIGGTIDIVYLWKRHCQLSFGGTLALGFYLLIFLRGVGSTWPDMHHRVMELRALQSIQVGAIEEVRFEGDEFSTELDSSDALGEFADILKEAKMFLSQHERADFYGLIIIRSADQVREYPIWAPHRHPRDLALKYPGKQGGPYMLVPNLRMWLEREKGISGVSSE